MRAPSQPGQNAIGVPDGVLFRDLGGEAVILELGSGNYYGLNEVATRIWLLLAQGQRIEAVCDALLREYDVAEERLRLDVSEFIDALTSEGLLRLATT